MQEQAVLTTTEVQLNKMIDVSSVGYFDEMYVQIDDGRLRVLVGNPGSAAGGYIDFVEAFFEDLEGSVEAYLDVGTLQNYLNLVTDSQSTRINLRFEGGDNDRLASRLTIEPEDEDRDFEVSIVLPSGESVIESVPAQLPQMFNDQNQMINSEEGRPPKVEVESYISSLRKIVDAVELRDDLEYYPVSVKNDEMRLEVGDRNNQRVNARLKGDVEADGNHVQKYKGQFKQVTNTLDGTVTVSFEEGSPLLLLQERNHMVIRHMIGAAA